MRAWAAGFLAKAGPVLVFGVTTWLVWQYDLNASGVMIVGAVPQSLPPFNFPDLSLELISVLIVPALLISIIGFVEFISVAQSIQIKNSSA